MAAAQANDTLLPLPKTLAEPSEQPLDHLKDVGILPLQTEQDHRFAVTIMDTLVDTIRDAKTHPLVHVLEALANQVKVYEHAQ